MDKIDLIREYVDIENVNAQFKWRINNI
jgi:hypothetical protein